MKTFSKILLTVFLSLVLTIIGCGGPADDQETTNQEATSSKEVILELATMPAGSLQYIHGSGVGSVISEKSPYAVRVKPLMSDIVWIPMILTDEIDFGITESGSVVKALLGEPPYESLAELGGVDKFPIRLACSTTTIYAGMLVRGDSPIKHVSDLKGKRVTYMEAGFPPGHMQTTALLANGGLTWDDVIPVPVPGVVAGATAVMEGRADANLAAVGAAFVVEAESKVGARLITIDDSEEAVKKMQEYWPSTVTRLDKGIPGVPEPIDIQTYNFYLVTRENMDSEIVYNVVKALWENNEELVAKPGLAGMTTDRFFFPEITIPLHEGAVKYYKEIGAWNEEMDKIQEELLSLVE